MQRHRFMRSASILTISGARFRIIHAAIYMTKLGAESSPAANGRSSLPGWPDQKIVSGVGDVQWHKAGRRRRTARAGIPRDAVDNAQNGGGKRSSKQGGKKEWRCVRARAQWPAASAARRTGLRSRVGEKPEGRDGDKSS